ncbi:MAG: GNAT family N-acetyltransferase, partial [Flavobacterium sp.]
GNKIFELNKMAVTKSLRGNSIGAMLMEHAVSFAKKKKAKQLYLETNRNLSSAIHLYQKFGFTMVPPQENSKFRRSNVKMSLTFR